MSRTLRAVILFVTCIGFLTKVSAQNAPKVVTGTVYDEKGTSLPGVGVKVKGTNTATSTNIEGKYSISVPSNTATLVFSFIGTKTQEVLVGAKTVVNVNLLPLTNDLSDVVVIGYGSVRKADVTSSISSVSEKDIKNLPVAGIDQALQGKVAGVSVTNNGGQPGGGVSVRVRGITSVNGNEPLYVIDGVPLQAQSNSLDQSVLGGGSGQTGQSVLATLNPQDIESIDILKDASAQAIYGSRGANGVVLVNTKRGKSGQGKITYDVYYGIQEIPKKLDVMNLQQYATYANSLVSEIRAAGGAADTIAEFKNPAVLGHGTDWQDEIYQQGRIISHQLSFSGGADKTNYYISGGYFDQKGTLVETGFKRYTLRVNVDHQIKSYLKVGLSSNMSRSNQKIGLSDGFDAVTSTVLYNSPATPVRDFNGNFISQNVIGGSTFGNPNNPVALASLRDVSNVGTKVYGAVYAELNIFKGLTLRNEGNYDFNLSSDRAFQPYIQNATTGAVILSPSRIREQRNNSLYWILKNYFNYNRSFGKHSVSATVGHESQKSKYDYVVLKRDNLKLNLPSINAGDAPDATGARGEDISAGAGIWSMESLFARAGYTFDNKYSITGTIRRDGSSSFGPGNRWGTFPAASASWTASNEEFLKDSKYINYLKLRIGYGVVGNQSVSGNNVYASNIILFPSAPFGPGGLPYNVPNPDLSWESVKTYNGGIDLTTANRRLELTVDLYKKVSTKMLLSSQLGAFSGLGTSYNDIQTPITNDGKMTNTGFDISVTSYNLQNKDGINWKTNFIFSRYKNTLNSLNTSTATILGEFNEYGTKSLVSLTRPGRPVGAFYGYVTDGLFTSVDQLNAKNYGLNVAPNALWLGDIRYKDLNNDGKIDDKDVTEIGNPNPKFTAGLTNTFNYKGFDLSIFLYGSYGADIFNYTRRQTEGMNNQYTNQLAVVLDRYTATNTGATTPRFNQWSNNNIRISDRYVEDGSYLRIQNVSLGYNLPKSIISKAKFASLRIYASVQNLYTFTNYSGYDPELGALNNRVTFMNVDNGHYPNPRTFTIGTNIEF